MLKNDSWSGEKLSIRRKVAPAVVSGAFKKSKVSPSFLKPSSEDSNNSSSNSPFLLEPTPIAPSRMTIVHRVEFSDSNLMEHDVCFKSCLSPLLIHPNAVWSSAISCGNMEAATSQMQGLVLARRQQQQQQQHQLGMPNFVSSEDLSGTTAATKQSLGCSSRSQRESHLEKWNQRFRDLVDFRKVYGHCLVPLEFPENPPLAHWVKRQRCQYKAKMEGRHSTLSIERQEALEDMGFIWDSHKATWEERLNEIIRFKAMHGHTNIPSKYSHNPQLCIWVKCQRRQFKLFLENKKSNMTPERVQRLSDIGFDWAPRQRKLGSSSGSLCGSMSSDLF